MSRLFYHVMQDNAGNLLFDVSGTMRVAGSGTLATIYGDEELTVVLPNPMTNHPSFGSFKCFLGAGAYDFYMAKSGYTFETLTGVQGHGTMALQNANAVTIGGHANTGVLDVQGSVVASDSPNAYFGVRVWPVAPGGTATIQGVRIEPLSGTPGAGTTYFGMSVNELPAGLASAYGYHTLISAGTNRWNVFAGGTAQNYFAGNVGIAQPTPSYPLDVTGQARIIDGLGINYAPSSGVKLTVIHNRAAGHHGIIVGAQPGQGDTGGYTVLFNNASGVGVGSIQTTATATAFNTSSDVRLKHAVQALGNALSTMQALRPVRFRWNADDRVGHGFLAHELQQVVPDAVTGEPDAVNDDGSVRPQGVDHSKLVPWLTACCQELAAQVQTLTARVANLEQQLVIS